MTPAGNKTCCGCGVEKPLAEFYHVRKHNRPTARCKACIKQASVDWRLANPGKAGALAKAWRDADPKRAYESGMAWRRANPEKARQKDRERYDPVKQRRAQVKWNAKNKERVLEMGRRWAKANPHVVVAKARKRQHAEIQAVPNWADLERIKQFYAEASRVSRETGIKHHVDHIVPVRHPAVCGLHCESNLQILTREENLAKSNRWWPDMPT